VLILNRDLRASDVPRERTETLELPTAGRRGYCDHPSGCAQIWRFARTFDLDEYAEGTGIQVDAAAVSRPVARASGLRGRLWDPDVVAALGPPVEASRT
jgi:hypothetical protein